MVAIEGYADASAPGWCNVPGAMRNNLYAGWSFRAGIQGYDQDPYLVEAGVPSLGTPALDSARWSSNTQRRVAYDHRLGLRPVRADGKQRHRGLLTGWDPPSVGWGVGPFGLPSPARRVEGPAGAAPRRRAR